MSLLASYLITLEPLNPGLPITQDTGVKARGLLYDLLAEGDASLATEIHDSNGLRPFTCTALLGRNDRGPHGEELLGSGAHQLRYTALNGAIAEALWKALERRHADACPLELGPFRFRIRRAVTGKSGDSWGQSSTYARLAQCPPRDTWRLSFRSPTAFRQETGHLPLPVPVRIFGSALDRWNAFCPPDLQMAPDLLQVVSEAVFPAHLEIKTRTVGLEHGRFVGFVGRVDLVAVRTLLLLDLSLPLPTGSDNSREPCCVAALWRCDT